MARAILLIATGVLLGAGATYYATGGGPQDVASTRTTTAERLDIRAPWSEGSGERIPTTAGTANGLTTFSERAAMYALAAEAGSGRLEVWLRDAAALPRSRQNRLALEVLLSRYVELDPRGAVALAWELNLDHSLVAPMYAAWARADPSGALNALTAVTDPRDVQVIGLAVLGALGEDERALSEVLASLPPRLDADRYRIAYIAARAATAPELALRQALATENGSARSRALNEVAEILARQDPRQALGYLESIEDDELRYGFGDHVMRVWSRLDPEGVLEYLMERRESDREEFRAAFHALDEIAKADPVRLLATIDHLPTSWRRGAEARAIRVWAETDPLAALAYVEALPRGRYQEQLLQTVASGYAKQNPEAAFAWAQAMEPKPPGILENVINGMMQASPGRALNAALSIELPMERQMAVRQVARQAGFKGKEEAILHELLAISDSEMRGIALRSFSSAWISVDADAAMEWVLANSERLGVQHFHSLARVLASRDPAGAAAYIDRIPTAARGVWVAQVAGEYAEADPAGARAWISGFKGESFYEGSVLAIVEKSAHYDPVSAAQLLDAVDDSAHTASAARTVAWRWAQVDPVAAVRWAEDLRNEQARANAVSIAVQHWGHRRPAHARSWVMTLPHGSTRDAALSGLLRTVSAKHVPDEALFRAFASDGAREQAVVSIMYSLAQHDVAAARAFIEEYITNDTYRRQAEQMLTSAAMQYGVAIQ